MRPCQFLAYWACLELSLLGFFVTVSAAHESPIADFANTGTPHWSYKPAYESVKSRVSYVPGIKVIRGETQVIVPEHKSFCPAGSVFKFNNGDIQVHDRRSSDGGKTWHPTENVLENSTYQYPEPDGEVILFNKA